MQGRNMTSESIKEPITAPDAPDVFIPRNKDEAYELLIRVKGDKNLLSQEQIIAIHDHWGDEPIAFIKEPVKGENDIETFQGRDLKELMRSIRQEAINLILIHEDPDYILTAARARNEDAGSTLSEEVLIDIIKGARVGASYLHVPWHDEEKFDYNESDHGNVGRLLSLHHRDIRFCPQFKSWYIWNGQIWGIDDCNRIMILATEAVKGIYKEAQCAGSDERRISLMKWGLRSESYNRRQYMVKSAEPYAAVRRDAWDARDNLFNCRNGTLDLEILEMREHRRDDMLTKMAGVEYQPDAECPLWQDHLDLVFSGDEEVIRSFREMCGYSLLADNPEQVMFILHGSGKNGKSKTLSVISSIMGDYARNIAPESLTAKRGDSPRSDIARLTGCRLVTSSEGEEGSKLGESWIKQLTGGDPVTVRYLYQPEFEDRPGYKIWLATNHKPSIRGTDEAIWRRIWLLPFEVTIPEDKRDQKIGERFLEEAPGIFNWMIEGLRSYHENGDRLNKPAKVVNATSDYRMESDTIKEFLDTNCRKDPSEQIARGTLYGVYKNWCTDNDDSPLSPRKFANGLRERGIVDGSPRNGTRYWKGIRFREHYEAEQGSGLDRF